MRAENVPQVQDLYQASQQGVQKLSEFVAETGQCPFEEFGGWKDCNDAECQKLKGGQPKDKSARCWRRWSGCPTCNKGFGQQQPAQHAPRQPRSNRGLPNRAPKEK